MKPVSREELSALFVPLPGSHKGQNGRMLLIGGSHLFHAASLWALTTASRIVDLVHYCSVSENNEIVTKAKAEFRNGIVIARANVESYIQEDDCILIGPGMVRSEGAKIRNSKFENRNKDKIKNINDISMIENEGEQTRELTNYLLAKYPKKQWVIDAGALQMVDISLIPKNAILTPHHGEFEGLWTKYLGTGISYIGSNTMEEKVKTFALTHSCIVLLKGERDIACDGSDATVGVNCKSISGGNAGMTKGGTGDVLSGLIAALACKNDPFLATIAGSLINKQAGDELYKTVGPYFNSTDLANEIPKIMVRMMTNVSSLVR